MNRKRAEELGGKLSYPSKMDVAGHGIDANRCRVGSQLRNVVGSTCEDCYALKGAFLFPAVKTVMQENYEKLKNELWTPALAAQIRWLGEERFRWMVSGDVQGIVHLRNIIRVCLATPEVCHWLPTREANTVRHCPDAIPSNLVIRLSAAMVDGDPPRNWPTTSTVVSAEADATCPSSVEGGSCADNECTACWDRSVGNVAYLKH